MKFDKQYTLLEIASLLGIRYVGEVNHQITGLNEIHFVESGDIVFVDHPKYYSKALNSSATTILINREVECPKGKALLISNEPFSDFNRLITHFRTFGWAGKKRDVSLGGESFSIGEGSQVHPSVVLGENVVIGKNCQIHPNVTIYDHTVIGDRVTINAGSVIGSEGFYFKKRPDGFEQLVSGGRVILGDDVTIGACSSIDRGVTADTTIGTHTKVDNHVHIGHDTQIGKKCLIAAHVGISGCVIIEDEVTLWGQVGVVSGITIEKGVVVLAQSGVKDTLKANKTYFGSPAQESKRMVRQLIGLKKLPDLLVKLAKKDKELI